MTTGNMMPDLNAIGIGAGVGPDATVQRRMLVYVGCGVKYRKLREPVACNRYARFERA